MRWLALATVLAACGDNLAARGEFEIVGHTDLGLRGMNAAIAIAGDVAYVGSRIDSKPVLIVDIKDPANPHVVGEIGMPAEALAGMSSRELRATTDPPYLFVLNLMCSPTLHGCASVGGEVENVRQYDISTPLAPQVLGTHYVTGGPLRARSPHEFFVWQDPTKHDRVVLLISAPGRPSLEVVAATPTGPTLLLQYDPFDQGGVPRDLGENDILHSVSASDDGRTLYLSHQVAGLYLADASSLVDQSETPMIQMITTPATAVKFGVMGPHSAVPVPGRKLLATTEEVYPPPFGAGCPWGWVRMVDIANPAAPAVVGEYKLPENDPSCAADGPRITFTSHNLTATSHVALATWYAGGLQAIDISDPAAPFQLAEFRPEPLVSVMAEDPGLGGSKVEMWSYPIIKNGLIYVIDSRNGLYVLRYHGRWAEEIKQREFLEGNSNLGAYLARD
jgi:hypothetical protein